MRRWVFCVCLLLAACGSESDGLLSPHPLVTSTDASPSEVAVILERVSASDPLEVIWGAYLAEKLRVGEAETALRGALARTTGDASVNTMVFEALVTIGAEITPDELARFAQTQEGDEAMVSAVALSDPARYRDVVFDLWARTEVSDLDTYHAIGDPLEDAVELNLQWVALADALVELRDPEFVAELVVMASPTIDVRVTSPGGSHTMIVAGRCGGVFSEPWVTPYRRPWTFSLDEYPEYRTRWRSSGEHSMVILQDAVDEPSDALEEQALLPGAIRLAAQELGRTWGLTRFAERNDPLPFDVDDVAEPLDPGTLAPCSKEPASGELAVADAVRSDRMLLVGEALRGLTGEDLAYDDVARVTLPWRGAQDYVRAVDAQKALLTIPMDNLRAALLRSDLLARYELPEPRLRVTRDDARTCGRAIALPEL